MEQEQITLEEDMTEKELENYAEEYMWNTKQPEWGFSEKRMRD